MVRIYAPIELWNTLVEGLKQYQIAEELMEWKDVHAEEPIPDGRSLVILNNRISKPPNWFNTTAPVLFPEMFFDLKLLAGFIFLTLKKGEDAMQLFANQPTTLKALYQFIGISNGYEFGKPIPEEDMTFMVQFNQAVTFQYGLFDERPTIALITEAYENTFNLPASENEHAFALKHYGILLNDSQQYDICAEKISLWLDQHTLHEHGLNDLRWIRCQARLKMIALPYDEKQITAIKQEIWQVLGYYEKHERKVEQAQVLFEASFIASINESFAEALGYLNKAIEIFASNQLDEFLPEAQLRKGYLLYSWAQNGQPQFFRAAKDAFMEALKSYTRDDAPQIFAEIHHYLGIIYSEIPDEVQKKSIWAGVSVSSFKEALSYYNKIDYPYEFAQICNHFGNAFTKFPVAALGDNFEKALNWYREALDIRTADEYPLERCLTLNNYINAAWYAGNPGDGWNEERWHDMWEKVQELKTLAPNEELIGIANEWIDALIQAKAQMKG